MEKRIIGLLTVMLVALKTFAGYDVLFCLGADSLGNCKESADEFKWNGGQMKIHTLLLNKDGLNTTRLSFKVFEMKSKGDPDLAADLSETVAPKRLYAEKDILFFKPGRYKVDIYNAANNLISSSFVTITDR
jgi:hypothetical protein